MNRPLAQWALLAVLGLIPWAEPVAKEAINVVSLAPADGVFRSHFPRFETAVEANFDGDVDVVLLIDGQAGSEETMMSALRRGRAQYGVLTMAGVSAAVPEFSLLMAPYLFDSFEEADFVLDNFVFDFAARLLDQRGLLLLKWIDSGWWNVFAQTNIADPKDMHGVRMRASSSAATVVFLKELGADVIPLPFGELVPGLQTGLVEGGATNTSMYSAVALYDHAPNLIMTRHALNPGAIMVNKRWFRRLSPANQDVIWETMASADAIRRDIRLEEQQALASIAAAGITPQELTSAQRQAWKAPSTTIHSELIQELGGETEALYQLIQAGKAAFAKQTRDAP